MAKGDPRINGGGTGFFPAVYQSALSQSAEDYDSLMDQYKNLGNKAASAGADDKINFTPTTPTFGEAAPDTDFSQLEGIANTGGFNPGDVDTIRASAVAPIRSIYDSANRNLLRQKNIQGGYSPNFGAIQAKLARESSNLISGSMTDANAKIAEMVQRGKLAGATSLAPLNAGETARKQNVANMNTSIANTTAESNANRELATAKHNVGVEGNDFNNILESIRGQQSVYGTTPAFASTIGGQVMNAANTVNNFAPIQRRRTSGGIAVGMAPGSMGTALNIPRLGRG